MWGQGLVFQEKQILNGMLAFNDHPQGHPGKNA
jgi:hypothetical protein